MTEITMNDVQRALKCVTATVLRNEKYFSDLDAAAGDADFGVSLAAGFREIDQHWDELDHSTIGALLLKISMMITRHVGGCSGPIWGTGVMRAAALTKDKSTITLEDLDQMLTAGIEGIQKRGGAEPGDKTLVDALIPVRDTVREHAGNAQADTAAVLEQAARVAEERIEGTKDWVARRGRQYFTGERSRGSPDPGIVAIATILKDLCEEFGVSHTPSSDAVA